MAVYPGLSFQAAAASSATEFFDMSLLALRCWFAPPEMRVTGMLSSGLLRFGWLLTCGHFCPSFSGKRRSDYRPSPVRSKLHSRPRVCGSTRVFEGRGAGQFGPSGVGETCGG